MLEYIDFNSDNEKILCEMNGKNADMLMTIKVKKLRAGESFSILDNENETAILLIAGELVFAWDGETRTGARKDAFEMKPWCLHTCKGTEITLTANKDSEIAIQQTDNDIVFSPVFYAPEDCLYQEFGLDQWGGAGHRVVSTMFDYDNAPYSNLVLGEVFNKAGRWSSYPPHHHPQPEVYYYQFDKPQGFGACFNGETPYRSTHGSFCTIHDGEDHEQCAAPGYEMYYVWMIRHLDGNPWYKTTRISSPEHSWLVKDTYKK